MSSLKIPSNALFFVSVVYDQAYPINDFIKAWEERYGVGELFYPDFNPSFGYYSKEMGDSLKRLIYFSSTLHPRDQIVEAKLWSTQWEMVHSKNANRSINIDPGLLTLENMILSTGKPFAHRIYLGQGVYADLNYIYQKGGYQTLPWTYPDYAHPEKVAKFEDVRRQFLLK